ncbi:hypothetical protein KA005_78680, partial [bacterium]|nr:hypothetical protein [bacterium]
MKNPIKEINDFINRKPFLSNTIFLIIGIFIPAATFKDFLSELIFAEVPAINVIIGIIAASLFFFATLRVTKLRS